MRTEDTEMITSLSEQEIIDVAKRKINSVTTISELSNASYGIWIMAETKCHQQKVASNTTLVIHP